MKRILILNWRDPWHPKAGGAELVTLRLAEGLAARGSYVEWFSATYANAMADEVRKGVRYIRGGSQYTVHLSAYLRYRKESQNFDVVIDEINTIPFYSPVYSRAKTIAYINQLAQEVWHYEMPAPVGALGAWLEPLYLAPYRRCHIVTISPSSARTLRAIGLNGRIDIIPMAVDEIGDPVRPPKKEPVEIIVVCRMTPSKRVEHAIEAARILVSLGWQGRLNLVGAGRPEYITQLRRQADQTVPGRVVFHGRVSAARRAELLRQSSVLWATSVREGWGLVVTEAARHWTPSVVYDVPGLQDSVLDSDTGSIVAPSPYELAKGTQTLLSEGYDNYSRRAYEQAATLSWRRTIDAFSAIVDSK